MPIYFAIEGIVGCGKTTLLEWLKMMLLEGGHTFYIIPKPVEKFKKITYNPLDKCYKNPTKSTALAQIHIMDESVRHYTEEVTKARKMKLDLVVSERSIVSPLIFTDTYFRHSIFSTFMKDSIDMMWGDETRNDVDIAAVKPDVIIFLNVPANVARAWVKKEPADSSHSDMEHKYLTKTSYEGAFLDFHEKACQQFMDMTDIPHHAVALDGSVTHREAAQEVYKILMMGICADGGSKMPVAMFDELFLSDE